MWWFDAVNWYLFALASLAVFRITYLLAAEDGPWDALLGLRRFLGASVMGRLMDCFNCLSLWVAIPFALLVGDGWRERGLLWPALSGTAILLQRLTNREAPLTAPYFEDEEDNDGMLRERPGENRSTGRTEDESVG